MKALGSPTGLVVPMFSEAAALFGRRGWPVKNGRRVRWHATPGGGLLICTVSQPGPQNARAAARWLVRRGVRRLAVCGVAGGLHPALKAGDLVVADLLADLEASPAAMIPGTEGPCAVRVQKKLSADGLRIFCGTIASSPAIVPAKNDKARLYRHWRALAVDMESAAVAAVAAQNGLPALVLRAVCDPQRHTLPKDLIDALDAHGRIMPVRMAIRLLRRPQLAGDLLQLSRSFVHAARTLKRARHVIEGI